MNKINPKIVLMALGLFVSSVACGQKSKRVDETSVKEFIEVIRNTTGPNFLKWYSSRNQSVKAIVRLDSILSLANYHTLQGYYDTVAINFMNDTLATKISSNSVLYTNSKLAKYGRSEKKQMRQSYEEGTDRIKQDIFQIRRRLIEGLIILCRMHSESEENPIKSRLSYISNRETARDLHMFYLDQKDSGKLDEQPISPFEINRNLVLISDHLNLLDNEKFMLYSSITSSPKKFKSIEVNHGNDIFTDLNLLGFNQDREMTGSFRLSVTTDYFKARYLNVLKDLVKKQKYDVLSYQTISFGGAGYTPYIRYQDNIELADTFHNYDRPFGSFIYLSRSKNRLWQNGLIRQMGEFQVGFIGLEAPDAVQSTLHKDAVVESQRVHGWNKQIGNPGRLAIQLNQDFDFLLYSKTNKYKALFSKANKDNGKYSGVNVIGSLEGKYGGYLTSVGGGLRISNLDFMHQSGQNAIVSNNKLSKGFGWHTEAGVKYRRVIHNSMLEGLGYLKTFDKDNFDTDPINFYALASENVQRNMLYVDWKVVLQCRKMTFYLQQTFHNMEYNVEPYDANSPEATALLEGNLLIEDNRREYYNNVSKEEYSSLQERGWYGYGTLGIIWLIN